MDLIFKCVNCDQELAVNPAGAGTEIQCPTCGETITIPEPEPQTIRNINPISTSAAAKEIKQFNVPVRTTPTEVLVKKKVKPLEVAAADGEKKLRIRTIKRTECLEVGHDKFDETVSELLSKIGPENLISATPITYSHFDLNTRQSMMDYGIIIVYKG
jgi:DNA-directed RNA polymerase subunit RPC12/RpoP